MRSILDTLITLLNLNFMDSMKQKSVDFLTTGISGLESTLLKSIKFNKEDNMKLTVIL